MSTNQALATPLVQEEIDPVQVRRIILGQSKRANVGHIGSCLCVVDILCALYSGVMNVAHPSNEDRDRLILSKGHAALALYSVLCLRGWISESELDTFCGDNSRLGVHPEPGIEGIDFAAGSLGHGLGIAAGAALAAKMLGSKRRIFCIISDAECNEGSVWEAAMFAAHQRLGNLVAILDWNGQQALGRTCDVLESCNMQQRWNAFGWTVSEVDGHSVSALKSALSKASVQAPHIVLAKTVFGKGVSYMERGVPITQTHLPVQPINWHYLPMSDSEFALALSELDQQQTE